MQANATLLPEVPAESSTVLRLHPACTQQLADTKACTQGYISNTVAYLEGIDVVQPLCLAQQDVQVACQPAARPLHRLQLGAILGSRRGQVHGRVLGPLHWAVPLQLPPLQTLQYGQVLAPQQRPAWNA